MTNPDPYQAYQYPTQYPPPVAYPGAYVPYPPPRKPNRFPWVVGSLVVFVLAVLVTIGLAVSVSSPKSAAPVKSQSELIHEWQAEVKPDVTNLENAMQDLADVTDPVNIADLHSACARVEQYAGRILNHLPTAHAQLADEMYQAMSQYVNAGQSCQDLTLYSPASEVDVVAGFINEGNEHLGVATAIIKSFS